MSLFDASKSLIEKNEGRRGMLYKCTEGKNTIGVGRNLDDVGLRDSEIDLMLKNDIDECIEDLETMPWFNKLNDARKCAMIDMRFQLGPTRFRQFKRMISAIEKEDYISAADEIKLSKLGVQTPERARRNIKIVLGGEL